MSSLLPQGSFVTLGEKIEPSKTWKVDFENQRITGMIDQVEAILQAAQLALQTTRFAHLIYTWDYGSELDQLVGQDFAYVSVEAERLVSECLEQDQRIEELSDFRFVQQDETIHIQFTMTIQGNKVPMEVIL